MLFYYGRPRERYCCGEDIFNYIIIHIWRKDSAISEIIETFSYDVTDGTVVSVKEADGVWTAEPITLQSNTLCILSYSGNDGWQMNEQQQFSIDYDLEYVSDQTEGKFFLGIIDNGQQRSAIPLNDPHVGIGLDLGGTGGEYYIYFMNTSDTDITVSNLNKWIQDEGKMDKYIF